MLILDLLFSYMPWFTENDYNRSKIHFFEVDSPDSAHHIYQRPQVGCSFQGSRERVLAIVVPVSPQQAELILQVCDPLHQGYPVGLSPLVRLPAGLLDLPLIPTLHLG